MTKVQKRIIRLLWVGFLVVGFFIGGLILLTHQEYFGKLPNLYEIKNPVPKLASEVYSEDGVLLGKFYSRFDRIRVSYQGISHHTINALIDTEDERFYSHSGLDFWALFRAIIFLGTEGGGSTITQQLAKNLFTKRVSRGLGRVSQKIKEWIIAIKLERNFSKYEILTLYLNTVPFGDNVYGIRNAALTFFQKSPNQLTIEEAALLVGLLKSNTTYNPRINPESAMERRNVVFYQMHRNKHLSAIQFDSLKQIPIKLNYLKLNEKEGIATYFREHIRKIVKNWATRYKKKTGKLYNIYTDGLKIYTTLNSRMQKHAENSIKSHISKMQKIFHKQIAPIERNFWLAKDSLLTEWVKRTPRYRNMLKDGVDTAFIMESFIAPRDMRIFTWDSDMVDTVMTPLDSLKYHKTMLQVGAFVVNPHDGKVKVWAGGINFKVFKYDHVKLSTKRQVGSTIKPLLYAFAMERHGFTPQTLCANTSQCFATSDTTRWCTNNNPGSRTDSVTSFAEGIVFSLNNVSAFVLRHTDVQEFARFLNSHYSIQSKIYPYPSLALGTSEISLYEMVRAYTVFPTNGILTDLQTILRIEDKNGQLIQQFPPPKKRIVLSEKTAYSMSQIMQGTVNYGTGRRIRHTYHIKGEIGGKTGTTDDYSDAWFIGFRKNILGGVWVGCDDKIISFLSSSGEGSSMALPIFGKFLRSAIDDPNLNLQEKEKWEVPIGTDELRLKQYVSNVSKKGAESLLRSKRASPFFVKDSSNSLIRFILKAPEDVPIDTVGQSSENKLGDVIDLQSR